MLLQSGVLATLTPCRTSFFARAGLILVTYSPIFIPGETLQAKPDCLHVQSRSSRVTFIANMQPHVITGPDAAVQDADTQEHIDPQSSICKLPSSFMDDSLDTPSPQHGKTSYHAVDSARLSQAANAQATMRPATKGCCSSHNETKKSDERPATRLCSNCNTSCCREVPETLTENVNSGREPREAERWSDDSHLIVETLRWGSDSVAHELLAGLRMGGSVRDLSRSIRADSSRSDLDQT